MEGLFKILNIISITQRYFKVTFWFQGLRDRLLVWCSYCEVQVQQIESESLAEEVDPLTVLNQLKEELHVLDNARTELRDLGRTLIQQQGSTEVETLLQDYKKTEDQVLLKLAQIQVRMAQKEQETLNASSIAITAPQSLSDSGMYSLFERELSSRQGTSSVNSQPEAVRVRASTPEKHSSQFLDSAPPTPPVSPLKESPEPSQQQQQHRSYADVTKTPPRSIEPAVRTPPPPVSIKSDAHRHLELALAEWRQRLARLDHLIKTSSTSEPSVEAANEIVSVPLNCFNLINLAIFSFLFAINRPLWCLRVGHLTI